MFSSSSSFTVVLTRSSDQGLGLVLDHDNAKVPRVWVDALIPNSPATLSKKLRVGDQLVRVGGKDVRRADIDDVLEMLALREKIKLGFQRPAGGGDSGGSSSSSEARSSTETRAAPETRACFSFFLGLGFGFGFRT